MELKTLKDMQGEVGFECNCGKKWKSKDNAIFPKTLKQEAIKWAKELKNDNEPLNAVGFIKEFFNLTKEDLK